MRRKNSTVPERGVENQTITVGGLGTAGGDYKTRVRATTHEGIHSPWTADVEFTLTDATEGTASDPNLPDTVTNLVIRGMLNAIYVEFDDEFFATDKPLMSHNMGSYEIEVSNVSNAFPATGNVWTTTLGDDDDAGPPNGPTRKFKVPTGDGFICTGMKSTGSGGLEHFVRVRGINSRGSTSSAYSTVASVTLDTDDVSQTAVVIGQDAIYATHVKAGTLTAQELQAGTITAYEISSGQIFASQIQLPAANPGTDGEADEFHATRKFTIDQDGNMWWGNYDTIALAITGAQKSYITAAGNATFVGEISTDTVGNPRIVLADNTTGAVVDEGPSAGGYAYILGWTEQASEAIPGHAVWTDESGVAAGYFVAPRYHSGFNYSGVRLRDDNTTKAEAILVASTGSWAGVVKGPDVGNYGAGAVTHADSSFVISTADGAYIYNSANAPSSTTNRLYSLSGSLYWGDDEIGSGSGDLTAVTAGLTSGLSVTSGTGPIPDLSLNLGKLSIVTTPVVGDKVGIYDVSLATTGYCTIQDIVELAPQGDVTSVLVDSLGGLSVSGNGGPSPTLNLSVSNLTDGTGLTLAGTDDFIWLDSDGVEKKGNLSQIVTLVGSTAGDVTDVVATTGGGLYSGNSSGPVPSLSLSLLTNLDAGTLNHADWIAFHDNSLGSAKRTTAQDIANLSATTHLTNSGIWQTAVNGTIGISFGNMLAYPTPTTTDLLMFYDSSTAGISYQTIWSILALAPQTTAFTNGGLYTSTTSSASGTMKISFGNMTLSTATTADLLCFQIGSSNVIGYNSIANVLNLVGGATTPVTHDFYLSGSRIIQASGNIYMRGGSGANYGCVAWSAGQTTLYYGTGWQLQTQDYGVAIGGDLRPSTNGIFDLGGGNKWNYIYVNKVAQPLDSNPNGWQLGQRAADAAFIKFSSSQRLKSNITSVDTDDALARIKALRVVNFLPDERDTEYENGYSAWDTHRGFIAEEAGAVSHQYAVWDWWVSDDPADAGYKATKPELSEVQDSWTQEELDAYWPLDEAAPTALITTAILADTVAAIQELVVQVDGAKFQSQSAVDYCADFDAKMLAKAPEADARDAAIADLQARIAVLEG